MPRGTEWSCKEQPVFKKSNSRGATARTIFQFQRSNSMVHINSAFHLLSRDLIQGQGIWYLWLDPSRFEFVLGHI